MRGAACKGMPDLFDSITPTDHAVAKGICATCPVLIQCERLAREVKPYAGTWAGQLYVKGTRARRPDSRSWTRTQLLAAHVAYVRGARNDEINEGERVYQRLKKRAQYARARQEAS